MPSQAVEQLVETSSLHELPDFVNFSLGFLLNKALFLAKGK